MIASVRNCLLSLAWSLTMLSLAAAADAISFTVSADKIDRVHAPIAVSLQLSDAVAQQRHWEVTSATGEKLVGQLTPPRLLSQAEAPSGKVAVELNFIVPKLAAGESAMFTASPAASATAGEQFRWVDTSHVKQGDELYGEDSRELRWGEQPVVRYMFTKLDESSKDARLATYKPYHHVYDPAGKRYLTKGPGGVFPHHRGLYFGFNRISYGEKQTADTWHCNGGEDESHVAFNAEEAGPVLGRHRLTIEWHGKKKDLFAVETRELTVFHVPGGTLIDWATRLETKAGPVRLDGDPQHAGFQFRATQDVPDKTAKQTYYLRPDGRGDPTKFRNWPGDKSHANLPWNALSFVVDDQRYTCCYLDRPQNPKEARFSERDYGRFGSYFEYDLTAEHPLELNYRVWLQAGEMEVDQVSRLDGDFVEPASVVVK